MQLGSRLYRRAIETKLTLNNVCYHESLKEIGAFFGRYDAEFFSHEIPCSIDYPLAHPLIEARGVDYICGWLSRIIAENEFVCILIRTRCMPCIPFLSRI
jgi:hypothetical protein